MNEEFKEISKSLRKAEDEKDKLDNIVFDLREKQRKIQDRIKVNKYKNGNEENISFKMIDLENIESYIKKRDILFKGIETRKNNLKILEKEKMGLDKIIEELSIKNNDLSIKMDNYNKEGPKLMQKSYESLNNQRNMRDLEEKLRHEKEEEYWQKKRDLAIQNQEAKKQEIALRMIKMKQSHLNDLKELTEEHNKVITECINICENSWKLMENIEDNDKKIKRMKKCGSVFYKFFMNI
jgi:hypothetical protein